MKRTKERFGKLEGYNKEGVSGLKVFDGEDLEFQDRVKLQQLQQKTWYEQQLFEKNEQENFEKENERLYAEQTLAINRMRGMLESEHDRKRKEMNVMMKEYNKKLAMQKKDREAKGKYDETEMDLQNIRDAEYTRSTVYAKMKDEIESAKTSI